MKSKIHVFSRMFTKKLTELVKVNLLLFILFAAFAVPSAWADDLISDGNGGYYVNMSSSGIETVTIPANVTSFKVYDDGGKSGNYTKSSTGMLVLTAPANHVLQLTGTIKTGYDFNLSSWSYICNSGDKLSVYDGPNTTTTALLSNKTSDCTTTGGTSETSLGRLQSSGLSMTLVFNSNDIGSSSDGLDLTVKVVPVENLITYTDSNPGGSVTSTSPTKADINATVNFTYSYDSGYLVKDIKVTAENGDAVKVSGGWYNNKTASFKMPPSNVTVTSTYTNNLTADGDLYINMPKTGILNATIPAGVKSFKVYDDGGKSGNYSKSSTGMLVLTAPANHVLQLTGTIKTGYDFNLNSLKTICNSGDKLSVYDGPNTTTTALLSGKTSDCTTTGGTSETSLGRLQSSGRSMTLVFNSNDIGSSSDGLDLTVKVVPVDIGTISFESNRYVTNTHKLRSDSYNIYASFASVAGMGVKATLQYCYRYMDDGSAGWSEWYDSENYTGPTGVSKIWSITPEYLDNNIVQTLISQPNDPVYGIDFRVKMVLYDNSSGNEISEASYTSETSYTNKAYVIFDNQVKVTTMTGGDYELLSMDGIKLSKNQRFDNNTTIRIQALAPAGYEFSGWNTGETANPLTVTLFDDLSLVASYNPVLEDGDIELTTYISKYAGKTYDSPKGSPVSIDATNLKDISVTMSIKASADLCNRNCRAYLVFRKEGTVKWDSTDLKYRLTVPSNNVWENSRTIDFNSVSKNLADGGRFELKAVVKRADGTTKESGSISVNMFHSLKLLGCKNLSYSYTGETDGCSAVFEDQFGNKESVASGETTWYQYGAKVKLHPIYNYRHNFVRWGSGKTTASSHVFDEDYLLSSNEVPEITVKTDSVLGIVLVNRPADTVRFFPSGWEKKTTPYSGMTDFSLVVDGNNVNLASDTAFFIEKKGQSDKFAVNKLDSAFTPGDYTITIKVAHNGIHESERDSLWACNYALAPKWIDENMTGYPVKIVGCTETSPAVYYYRKDFTVNGGISFTGFTTNGGTKILTGVVIDGAYRGSDAIEFAADEFAVDSVVYNRSFPANAYSTIMLPFDVNTANIEGPDAVLRYNGIKTVNNVSSIRMKVVWATNEWALANGITGKSYAHTNLDANTPYLVQMKKDSLKVKGPVTLRKTTDPDVTIDNWTFRGTLQYKKWIKGDPELGYAYGFAASASETNNIKVGDFVKVGEGAWIRPLRAYLVKAGISEKAQLARANGAYVKRPTVVPEELPELMSIVIDSDDGNEEHTTVIGHFNTRTGEIKMNYDRGKFDLKGRRVNGEKPNARGAYYGKKVMKK